MAPLHVYGVCFHFIWPLLHSRHLSASIFRHCTRSYCRFKMLTRLGLQNSVRSFTRHSNAGLTLSNTQASAQFGFAKSAIVNYNRSFCQYSARYNSPDIKITSEELFRYTEGRWLVGDDLQQELRYVKFDVHELCRRAAEDIGDGTKVIRVEKLPSVNSRVLLLTMSDGKEFIAKIKCPITGVMMLSTLSEVTMLAFRMSLLQCPTLEDICSICLIFLL